METSRKRGARATVGETLVIGSVLTIEKTTTTYRK